MDEGLICRRVSQKDSRLHRGSHRFPGMPEGLFHHSVLISEVFFVCLFLDLAFDLHKLRLLRNAILVPLFFLSLLLLALILIAADSALKVGYLSVGFNLHVNF